MDLMIPTGLNEFSEIICENAYYVDKTKHFRTILDSVSKGAAPVQLFTRPRRFGKTLFLSTLEAFLKPNYENTHIKGLKLLKKFA